MADDYEYQERAAIMEFLANLPRYEAERLAREDMQRQNRHPNLFEGFTF